MTPNQFFTPLNNQSLLYPGQNPIYTGQCVQSVMMWLKATGTEPPVYPSAYLYYDRGITGYTKIPAGQTILEGDIVVWRKDFPPSLGNGHIDVASANGALNGFSAWDSNWKPLILSHILHNGNYNNYIAGYLRRNMATNSLTKEEIQVIYTLTFETNDVPQDIIDAYTGQPLDGLLTLLHNDPTWNKHFQEVNNPGNDSFQPYTGSQLYVNVKK